MKKFDYKKWLVENKFGKTPEHSNYAGSRGNINEQGDTVYDLDDQSTWSNYTSPEGTSGAPTDEVPLDNFSQVDCNAPVVQFFLAIPAFCEGCLGGTNAQLQCGCCEGYDDGDQADGQTGGVTTTTAGGVNTTTTSGGTTGGQSSAAQLRKLKQKGKKKKGDIKEILKQLKKFKKNK